jgi:hypothetical protein
MKTIVELVEELKEYLLGKDTAAKQAVESNIAPVEADASSASRTYEVGDQLFLNDVLYDVTSPISVGDAIVVGTNITAANKISANIQTLTNNVDVLIENGAINLLPIKCPNKTENNVTLTNNNDGSVTISGTASANTYFYLLENSRSHLEIIEGTGKSYTLSGCTSGSSSTYALRMLGSTDLVAWYTVGQIQTTEEMTFTEGAYPYYAVRLDVFSGTSVNVTIKPMLVDSKYKGTYQPYAKTNKELTEDVTPQEIDYTINSSIVNASPRLKLYKTGKEIISTGYIVTSVAAARNDILFTITNERPKDEYEYFLMVNSSGDTILTRFNSDGTVKVDADSMPVGGYIVFGTLICV